MPTLDSLQKEVDALKKKHKELERKVLTLSGQLTGGKQGEQAPEQVPEQAKTSSGSLALIIIGAVLTLTVFGAIIGIPLLIIGIVQANKKPKTPDGKRPAHSLEENMGMKWLGILGMTAFVVGMGYFIKYTVDNNWFGALSSIALALVLSLVLLGTGLVMEKKFRLWSNIMTGGGFALLYYTVYATYHFPAYRDAFSMNFLTALALQSAVVLGAIILSLRKNERIIASLSLLLGYTTAFLSTSEQTLTLPYVVILSVAYLLISFRKQWAELDYGSIVLTYGLFIVWLSSQDQSFAVAATFLAIYFVTFTLAHIFNKDDAKVVSLMTLNGCGFLATFWYTISESALAEYTYLWMLIMAAVYGFLYLLLRKERAKEPMITAMYAGLAYLVIALADKLDNEWVSLSWCALVVILYFLGTTTRMPARILLGIVVAKALVIDSWNYEQTRLVTFLVISLVLYGLSAKDERLRQTYTWLGSFFLLMLIFLEAKEYWITIFWAVLAIIMLIIGFVLNRRYLRLQGIIIFLLVILKVFLFDTRNLEPVWRTLSFIILGLLLLAASLIYARFKERIKGVL